MHVADMRFFVTVNIGHKPTTHNFGWCPGAQMHPTWPPSFNLSITRTCPGFPGTPGDIDADAGVLAPFANPQKLAPFANPLFLYDLFTGRGDLSAHASFWSCS